ncbi:MAG TPA: anti-sigma factor [Roseiflexaceae bacterium]|nr:anti-sigma factor [Roseiflexaceae bacterium]
MIDCNEVRELLAVEPAPEDEALHSHLAQCERCARYRRPQQALNAVLRAELQWQVPAALTAHLLALAATGPAALIMTRPQPKRWYVVVVYLLTAAAIGLSLAVAWQFFGLFAAQIGLSALLEQALAVPGQWLDQITQTLPVSPAAIQFLLKAREQLLWLLLVAVLWAVVDKWNPQFSLRRRQIS